ncbi:FUSC family protein [Micromonospora chersina]|uniref:FUSC family protein n=1 Tax=Micromonospora chersina TaxID=47854 RepID=UPI0033E7553A
MQVDFRRWMVAFRGGGFSRPDARRVGRNLSNRLRAYLVVAIQAGIAAALSWYIAHDLLGAKQALFAPAAAVGTIAASTGDRVRRTAQLIGGVLLGILAGQVVIELIGTGPVQTGVVVTLAISAAVAFRGSGGTIVQAASTAVLLGTISPLHQHLAVPRTVNALIGGLTAVVVALLILPLNPGRLVHRAGGITLDVLAHDLSTAATSLAEGDDQQIEGALRGLCAYEQFRPENAGVLAAAREVARLSPWRRRQWAVTQRYGQRAAHLRQVYTNSLETVRWALRAVRAGEPIPPALPASIEHLSQAIRLLHRDFKAGREPALAVARAEEAIQDVNQAGAEGGDFAVQVAIFQQRTALSALLQATGMTQVEANRRLGLRDDV